MLSPAFTITNAEELIELPVKFNVSFESQNVMKPSSCEYGQLDENMIGCVDYWLYGEKIKKFYVENEFSEITDYAYKFDVSEKHDGRVIAYLVANENNFAYYDLHLQSDGIIYPNNNASFYFNRMFRLETINNIEGFDTSNVTNMLQMFYRTGYSSTKLNTSITIRNPNTTSYSNKFKDVARNGSQITVNYTSATSSLVDKIIANISPNSNVVKGNLIVDVGGEISIGAEKFNVISQTDDTITMFAQYNIGTDNKQSTTNNYVTFSNSVGWEYTPGPKEIDIQTWSTNPKTLLNNYVSYLQTELGDTTISGDFITLTELKVLGCTINDDYSYTSGLTCANSSYKSWLINNQEWWTRSANSKRYYFVWVVLADSLFNGYDYDSHLAGVRPVITISRDALRNIN